MTQKSIWEKRWQKKLKNVFDSTSLDFFAQEAFKVLARHIDRKAGKILEIGSGTGRFCLALAEKYPQKSILGIDYTEESVALSKKGAELRGLSKVNFEKADLFHLPYPDNSFEIVFENGVVEHFENYVQAIQEMRRVAKVGGLIIVNVNNWYCFPKTLEKKLLGKYYPFGYEKSFKHREIEEVFQQLELKEMEVYAYNPANSIVRFFGFNQWIKKTVASAAQFWECFFDSVSGNRFSKKFGYMLFGCGRK